MECREKDPSLQPLRKVTACRGCCNVLYRFFLCDEVRIPLAAGSIRAKLRDCSTSPGAQPSDSQWSLWRLPWRLSSLWGRWGSAVCTPQLPISLRPTLPSSLPHRCCFWEQASFWQVCLRICVYGTHPGTVWLEECWNFSPLAYLKCQMLVSITLHSHLLAIYRGPATCQVLCIFFRVFLSVSFLTGMWYCS